MFLIEAYPAGSGQNQRMSLNDWKIGSLCKFVDGDNITFRV